MCRQRGCRCFVPLTMTNWNRLTQLMPTTNISTENNQGAWVPYHLLWDVKEVPELKVHFLNPDILEDDHWTCGHEGPLTVDIILAWATFWNGHAEYYPKFSNYVAKPRKAYIRVAFTKYSEFAYTAVRIHVSS